MPPNHRLTQAQEVRPTDLVEEDLILGDMVEWEAYRWRLNEMFAAEGMPLNTKVEASNTLALLGLVAAGLGVTVYPESLTGLLGATSWCALSYILHFAFKRCWRGSAPTVPIRCAISSKS
jgi:DNA-binding transcriptional LysR family regulator